MGPITQARKITALVLDEVVADSAIRSSNDTSLAVLPFVDLSPNKDQAYFADPLAPFCDTRFLERGSE